MDAEHYRRRARRYLIRAGQMLNPVNRATMVDMAGIWMRMAEWAKVEKPLIQKQPQQQAKPQVRSSVATSNPDLGGSNMILPAPWGGTVPIYRSIEDEPFHPEHVALMGNVFDDVLRTLGLVEREDQITRLVAKKVIELAQAGERDPRRLKRLTLEAFEVRPK